MSIYTYTFTYVETSKYTQIIITNKYSHIHTHVYIYTHIYTNTYTHT